MGLSKTALAIKSLYIFYHCFDLSVNKIGVMPDERRESVIKAMHLPGTNDETKEIEYEIYRLMVSCFT